MNAGLKAYMDKFPPAEVDPVFLGALKEGMELASSEIVALRKRQGCRPCPCPHHHPKLREGENL